MQRSHLALRLWGVLFYCQPDGCCFKACWVEFKHVPGHFFFACLDRKKRSFSYLLNHTECDGTKHSVCRQQLGNACSVHCSSYLSILVPTGGDDCAAHPPVMYWLPLAHPPTHRSSSSRELIQERIPHEPRTYHCRCVRLFFDIRSPSHCARRPSYHGTRSKSNMNPQ